MTDTPAESAEAPRTPEQWAELVYEKTDLIRDNVAYVACVFRAALAARGARWREALKHKHQGGQWWMCGNCDVFLFPEDDGQPPAWKEDSETHKMGDLWDGCPACAPLRALLSEGHDGK